ncbi:PREDICTED: uncharacterized protein LOC106805277 [Priapulus caudatus]|uniref:Uncharacterized protein LOC106805277 n=1 Tax=Priapulus caudatus TaxID=37621 RepID=A0ABM1DQS9_PRICU|nr:PREDICTED: uncharacterized protein LOC106805277 [Priapulus caudatus]
MLHLYCLIVLAVASSFAKHVHHYGEPRMGIANPICDDAKVHLDVDWDGDALDYTCPSHYHWPIVESKPLIYCHPPGTKEPSRHYCMHTKLEYDEEPPLSGNHRPLWPKYGEYRYVPPQRWVHNLEHGGVVLLYHPCGSRAELAILKSALRSCLRRHIITPYNKLTKEYPFAMVTWGCKLSLSHADVYVAKAFIMAHAKKGPEDLGKPGQFDDQLLLPAKVVPGSDFNDTIICPVNDEYTEVGDYSYGVTNQGKESVMGNDLSRIFFDLAEMLESN